LIRRLDSGLAQSISRENDRASGREALTRLGVLV
jgi:hypothetical protein